MERAVWLLSAATALRERLATPANPLEQAASERTLALANVALDDATFARAWEKGAVMTVEDIWKAIRTSAIAEHSVRANQAIATP